MTGQALTDPRIIGRARYCATVLFVVGVLALAASALLPASESSSSISPANVATRQQLSRLIHPGSRIVAAYIGKEGPPRAALCLSDHRAISLEQHAGTWRVVRGAASLRWARRLAAACP